MYVQKSQQFVLDVILQFTTYTSQAPEKER